MEKHVCGPRTCPTAPEAAVVKVAPAVMLAPAVRVASVAQVASAARQETVAAAVKAAPLAEQGA